MSDICKTEWDCEREPPCMHKEDCKNYVSDSEERNDESELSWLLTAEQQLRLLNLIDGGELQVCLICNDRFAPAADAIEVETFFELSAMLDASIKDADNGAVEFMRDIESTRDY